MKLFDTHFHFYDDCGTPEEYWEKIHIDGLEYVLAAGADYEESLLAQKFARHIENAWYSAGAHPHSAGKYTNRINMFEDFRDTEKLVAVGEIGLDYFYEHSERRTQWKVMEQFLELALSWNLPAIIHCRDQDGRDDAYEDCYKILRDFAGNQGCFELHCFAGSISWLDKFLELDSYIGVTGMVTFSKAHNIRKLIKYVPDNRLLLETDSPYLAPTPHRGKKNNPGYLVNVATKVAEEKHISPEECAKLTTANAAAFFNIVLP
ncbi:MAG: TatD family hydrolase [Victivallales bacterium]|nr:TatD family hydrolase [Victivallales bacterium]